jgi:hypothetical protein
VPTRLYRFHCVGPHGAATFDLGGQRLPTLAQVRAQADRVALALMESREADWTRWIVDVHDEKGNRVLVRPFPEVRLRPAPPAKTAEDRPRPARKQPVDAPRRNRRLVSRRSQTLD